MSALEAILITQHRDLDARLGRFVSAAHAGELEAAREAMAQFDVALRRHMALEEEELIPDAAGRRLVPGPEESERERFGRELRLEHVQIRELSGMLRRALDDSGDLEAARRLFPNFARRWDAHTEKEERTILATPPLDAGTPRP